MATEDEKKAKADAKRIADQERSAREATLRAETAAKNAEDMLAKLQEREKELDQKFEQLDEREKNLQSRQARQQGGGSRPRPFQPDDEVKLIRNKARAYLRSHYFQASKRELEVIESVIHALFETSEERRKAS